MRTMPPIGAFHMPGIIRSAAQREEDDDPSSEEDSDFTVSIIRRGLLLFDLPAIKSPHWNTLNRTFSFMLLPPPLLH